MEQCEPQHERNAYRRSESIIAALVHCICGNCSTVIDMEVRPRHCPNLNCDVSWKQIIAHSKKRIPGHIDYLPIINSDGLALNDSRDTYYQTRASRKLAITTISFAEGFEGL